MTLITPFAYGPVGKYLVATDTHEVFVCHADTQGPVWTHATAVPVVGVAATEAAILVLDQQGRFLRLTPDAGRLIDQVDVGDGCLGLSHNASGLWLAIQSTGVVAGRANEILTRMEVPGTCCAALDDGYGGIAVGTEREVQVFVPKDGKQFRQPLAGRATGLAWSSHGFWLVTTPQQILRFSPDLASQTVVATLKDNILSGGVVSPTGRIVAFRIGTEAVGLVGMQLGQLGLIQYMDRTVGELSFGPHPYLGIGIGLGDGNRISLTHDTVERTDPPADRQRNRWGLGTNIDIEKVAAELQLKEPQPSSSGGCFGLLLLAGSAALAGASAASFAAGCLVRLAWLGP